MLVDDGDLQSLWNGEEKRVHWLVVALSPGMAMSLQLQTRLVGISSPLFRGERGRYTGECRQCWVRGAAAAWKGSAGESAGSMSFWIAAAAFWLRGPALALCKGTLSQSMTRRTGFA